MITLKINNVPTIFIKAFSSSDVQTILTFIRKSAALHKGDSDRILFIDTPITPATVEAVVKLQAEGYRVSFRDHHGIDGEPANDREQQVLSATKKLRTLLDDCNITVRRLHPACSTLVEAGEFADAVAIVADPDADGLSAAMKAAGVTYPGLDEDAAKLDGEPQYQVTGTPISQLLAKGIAVIPSYDSSKPKEREHAHQELFADWLKAVQGNESARKRLEARSELFDKAVFVSKALVDSAQTIAPGVLLVDTVNKPLFDAGTLHAILEADPACRIIVLRKSLGPIAALHGIQYSLSVAKSYQNIVSLYDLLPADSKHKPEYGIISNVSFLLHVSESIWNDAVLPRLKSGL